MPSDIADILTSGVKFTFDLMWYYAYPTAWALGRVEIIEYLQRMALHHELRMVTRNGKVFYYQGLEVINPWNIWYETNGMPHRSGKSIDCDPIDWELVECLKVLLVVYVEAYLHGLIMNKYFMLAKAWANLAVVKLAEKV